MTADTAGQAGGGAWAALARLRDQWLLLVFAAGGMFWVRDTYELFAPLPAAMAELTTEMTVLQKEVAGLGAAMERERSRRTGAVMAFPGDRHGIADARAGEWTVARLVPTRPLRDDCRTVRVDAWTIDSENRWFSARTRLGTVPKLEGETDLAFDVRVAAEAEPGRAEALVQLTHDCGTHIQVQTAPRLPFRVIDHRSPIGP